MANAAYQVTGFAYQGDGAFAYQGASGGVTPTRHRGKGDNERRRSIKPLGLPYPKAKKSIVDRRVDESQEIAAEVASQIAREFGEERVPEPVVRMSLAEIDFEIGILLRKKLRTEEDEILLLLLMAASAC